MNKHNIKILEPFADAILSGDKTFEVLENDRGYQKGDMVKFTAVTSFNVSFPHPIEAVTYEITYVLSGWGIKDGWVVFGIKECSE